MQTILGYGGAVGRPLAEALAAHTDHVRCVARTDQPLPDATSSTRYTMWRADLLEAEACRLAVAGSGVVYLLVGLPYRTAVWERDWPVLVENVLAACAATGARLVFLDNVYALDPAGYDGLREDTPLRPASAKGRIRKRVLDRLQDAQSAGRVAVAVVRAADFYGPDIGNSLLLEMVLKKLAAGESALWLGPLSVPHAFTYTPDAGRALAAIGNDGAAFGQSWNVPTAPARSLAEWATAAGGWLGRPAKVRRLPRWVWWLGSLVSADLRELYDVRQQLLRPYRMDSGKFTERYGWAATGVEAGLREVMVTMETR